MPLYGAKGAAGRPAKPKAQRIQTAFSPAWIRPARTIFSGVLTSGLVAGTIFNCRPRTDRRGWRLGAASGKSSLKVA
jgi:hypothetical protein